MTAGEPDYRPGDVINLPPEPPVGTLLQSQMELGGKWRRFHDGWRQGSGRVKRGRALPWAAVFTEFRPFAVVEVGVGQPMLSPPMIRALLGLRTFGEGHLGKGNAAPATVKALVSRGLIVADDGCHRFTPEGSRVVQRLDDECHAGA